MYLGIRYVQLGREQKLCKPPTHEREPFPIAAAAAVSMILKVTAPIYCMTDSNDGDDDDNGDNDYVNRL